jgi:hypothetical protein
MTARSEHRLHVDATSDGKIRPHPAVPAVDSETRAGRERVPVAVDCHDDRAKCLDDETAVGLERGCRRVVADETIRQVMGVTVDRSRAWDTKICPSDASVVLERCRPAHLDDPK